MGGGGGVGTRPPSYETEGGTGRCLGVRKAPGMEVAARGSVTVAWIKMGHLDSTWMATALSPLRFPAQAQGLRPLGSDGKWL